MNQSSASALVRLFPTVIHRYPLHETLVDSTLIRLTPPLTSRRNRIDLRYVNTSVSPKRTKRQVISPRGMQRNKEMHFYRNKKHPEPLTHKNIIGKCVVKLAQRVSMPCKNKIFISVLYSAFS